MSSKPISSCSMFTVGQVARICGVCSKTVKNWFDTGRLKGFTVPGSKDRRIPKANLITFLTEWDVPIPVELLEGEENKLTAIQVALIEYKKVVDLGNGRQALLPLEMIKVIGKIENIINKVDE